MASSLRDAASFGPMDHKDSFMRRSTVRPSPPCSPRYFDELSPALLKLPELPRAAVNDMVTANTSPGWRYWRILQWSGEGFEPCTAGALLGLAGCALEGKPTATRYRWPLAVTRFPIRPWRVAGAAFDNPVNAQRLRGDRQQPAAHNMTPAAEAANADCLVSYALDRAWPGHLARTMTGVRCATAAGLESLLRRRGGAGSPYSTGGSSKSIVRRPLHQALWHAFVDTDVTELKGAEADQRIGRR
jgi:hypothetical protein